MAEREDQDAVVGAQSEPEPEEVDYAELLGEDQDTAVGEQSEAEESEPAFMSAEEVPEELHEQWRNMNKKFTETQQELARKRAELETVIETLRGALHGSGEVTKAGVPTAQSPAPTVAGADNDPVLQWIAQRYQEAVEVGDQPTMEQLSIQFQNRLDALQVKNQLAGLQNELLASKATAELRGFRNDPLFRDVWNDAAEKEILAKVKKGFSTEDAVWAVLGAKATARAVVKAHQRGRTTQETAKKASTPAGTASAPADEIANLSPSEFMHGDRPSIAKIWQKIKERGGGRTA